MVKTASTKKKSTKKKTTTTKKVTKKTNKNSTKKSTNTNKKVLEQEKVIEIKEENKKENLKKHNIILPIICVFVLLTGLITLIIKEYPRIKENIEIKLIEKEVNKLIKENDSEKVKEKISNDIPKSGTKKLEYDINSYLLENMSLAEELDDIKNSNLIKNYLDINNIDEDILKQQEETITSLDNILDRVEKIRNSNQDYKSEKLNSSYIKLKNKIDDTYNFSEIEEIKNNLNNNKPILEYLIKNKSSYNKDEEIVFLKRSKFNEFEYLLKESNCSLCKDIKYKLIEDTKGPVITASDITITEGTKINIKDKIKCIDEVDDTVDCTISGSYNSSRAGTYTITITSIDKSNNKSSKSIKVIVKAKTKTTTTSRTITTGNKPYYIEVIRNQNVVIVYGKDSNNKYTKIVKVFVVSVGKNGKTPTGTFKTTRGYQWGSLINGVWGQYTTRITGSYLFHSVPYYTKNKGNLEWQEYNKLGTAASAGCVRMTVRDAKWIYDNIADGTTVKIYDGSLPSGVTKPSAQKISSNSPNKGWDPTDPDSNNPWRK